jgi:hypothetical protein
MVKALKQRVNQQINSTIQLDQFQLASCERNQASLHSRAGKKQTVASGIVLRGIPYQANSCYVVATNTWPFCQITHSGKP